MWHWQKQPGVQREQSSALSFGTALHDAVMVMEQAQDLQRGLDRFRETWDDLSILDIEYDYLMPRNSHASYLDQGLRSIRDWWFLIQWESDVVLGREYPFTVPIGEHTLTGTIDKVALRTLKGGEPVVLVSDYKTNSKAPTRDYLAHDIQFSAYAYATTRPEFWANIPDGDVIFKQYADARRFGEWVHLRTTKRLDAGPRVDYHYNRLRYAIDMIAQADELGIYPPNISGEACEYCEYRKPCGLPSRIEEGLE